MGMTGFSIARDITRKYARTFYFASIFLDKEKRDAAYAVYAMCRLGDEAVDGAPCRAGAEALAKLKLDIDNAYGPSPSGDPLLSAFSQTVKRYSIPKDYFMELVSGMKLDLIKNRYGDFAQLSEYCYKAAGVVGLIMLEILGYERPEAKEHAAWLGTAMQLTNILRDVKEDLARGRVYLPQDEMRRFGVSDEDLKKENMTEGFKAMMRFQVERARDYYAKSRRGIKMVKGPGSRFVICLMSDLYEGILDAIEKNGYDVFSARAHVGMLGKLVGTVRIALRGLYR